MIPGERHDFEELRQEAHKIFNSFCYAVLRDDLFLVLGFKSRADTSAARCLCMIKIFDAVNNVVLEEPIVKLVSQGKEIKSPALSEEISLSLPEDILLHAHGICLYRVIKNEKSESITIFSKTISIERELV